MQKLQELREKLWAEIQQHRRAGEALENRLRGLDDAIAALSGVDMPVSPHRRQRRNVKKTVMDLIVESGQAGVTAAEIVSRAATVGRDLDRPSVSSLLSRLKRESVLTFDGERYRPAEARENDNNRLKLVGQ